MFSKYTQKTTSLHAILLVVLSVCILIYIGVGIQSARAAFNPEINYQGKLTDTTNVAVADGIYHMKFRLYTAPTGGTLLAEENRSSVLGDRVNVINGLFSVMLGSSTSLTSVDFNQDLWLEVQVGGTSSTTWETLSPRKQLGAVPAAFESDKLDGLDSTSFVRSDDADTIASTSATTLLTINQSGTGNILDLQDNGNTVFTVLDGGNVGIGTSSPLARFSVGGSAYIGGDLTATGTIIFSALSDGCVRSTSGVLGSTPCGSTYGQAWEIANGALSPTTTLGIGVYASSTIGNGTQQGGLTINGGATTTGNVYVGGNIGVGTANPTARLDIQASYSTTGFPLSIKNSGYYNAYFQGTDANDQASFYMENDRGSFASYGGFLYGGSTSGLGSIFGQTRADKLFMFADGASSLGYWIGTLNAAPFAIGTNNVERVRVTSSGNVGIGTTTPAEMLHVFGSDATIRVGNSTDNTSYSTFEDISATQLSIAKTTSSGAPIIDIAPLPTDGSSNSLTRFFRSTNTSGAVALQVFRGNNTNTINTQLGGNTSSYLNVLTGNVGVGTTTSYAKMALWGSGATSATRALEVSNSASSTLFIVDNSGGVGIATSSPFAKLSVGGAAYIGGNLTATGTITFTSLATGLLSVTSGVVGLAGAGTDYEVPLTFGDGLTRTLNDIDCDIASGSVFGCLATADWTKFDNKVSTTSIDTIGELETLTGANIIVSTEIDSVSEIETLAGGVNILLETEIDASSELAALMDDETGTGALVFGTNATLSSTTLSGDTLLSNATTTSLGVTTICFTGDTCRTSWPTAGSAFGQAWEIANGALSPTTTLGVGVYASSTIGNGTTQGGLTVFGNATTTGTLTVGTLTGPLQAISGIVSATSTISDVFITDALTLSGGTIGSNSISGTLTTTGTLTIGDNGDRIDVASSGWDVTNSVFTGGTWQGNVIGTTYGGTGLASTPNNGEILIGDGLGYTLGTISGGSGLTVTNGAGTIDIDCDVASGSVTGCLSTTDWSVFNNKISSTSIDTSAELASLITDETGSAGALVFSTLPTLQGFISNASSTIGAGTGQGGLTIYGNSTTTGNAYIAGNLGIGTVAPTFEFELVGSSGDTGLMIDTPSGTDIAYRFRENGSSKWAWGYEGTSESLRFGTGTDVDSSTNMKLTLESNGNVDVGTTTGYSKLSVWGSGTGTGQLFGLVNSASTTAVQVLDNGKVGIGTANPGSNLVISGSSAYAQIITTATNGSTILNFDETDNGFTHSFFIKKFGSTNATPGIVQFWNTDNADMIFATNNAAQVRITAAGNFGIATSSPFAKLSVGGAAYIGGNLTATGTVTFTGLSDGCVNVTTGVLGSTSCGGGSSFGKSWEIANGALSPTTTVGIGVYASSTIGAGTSQTGLTVSGNATTTGTAYFAGSVGIGTSSPVTTFHVNGKGSFGDSVTAAAATRALNLISTDAVMRVWRNVASTTSSNPAIEFIHGTALEDAASTTNAWWDIYVDGGGTDERMAFRRRTGGIAAGDVITLLASGNVGIGTAAPTQKLHVFDSSNVSSFLESGTGRANAFVQSGATNKFARFIFQQTSAGTNRWDVGLGEDATGSFYFGNADMGTKYLTLTSVGSMGVGTTTPYAKLSVWGTTVTDAAKAFEVVNSASSTLFAVFNDGDISMGSSTATTTLAGGLSINNGAVLYDYSTNQTSIENLNLGPISFDTDAGAVSWIDMPVSASAPNGTTESFSAQIDSNALLTVWAQANGSGAITKSRVVIGTSTDAVLGSANIPFGSFIVADGIICVDDNGGANCDDSARTRGQIYAESSSVTAIDLAENYPTLEPDLGPGEIVMLEEQDAEICTNVDTLNGPATCLASSTDSVPFVARATKASTTPRLLGIVSTEPGVLLGGFASDELLSYRKVPVALSGRVPLKVNIDNGEIKAGDQLTLSDTPGVAMKAATTSPIVAIALEGFDGTKQVEATTTGPTTATTTIKTKPGEGVIVAFVHLEQQEGLSQLALDVEIIKQQLALLTGTSTAMGGQTFDVTALEDSEIGAFAQATTTAGMLENALIGLESGIGFARDFIAARFIAVERLFASVITFLPGGTLEIPDGENEASGTGILTAGTTEVTILNTLVATTSKIFVTPTTLTNVPLVVTNKEEGVGFTISIGNPQAEDITFDWFLIQSYSTGEESEVITPEIPEESPSGSVEENNATGTPGISTTTANIGDEISSSTPDVLTGSSTPEVSVGSSTPETSVDETESSTPEIVPEAEEVVEEPEEVVEEEVIEPEETEPLVGEPEVPTPEV